MTDEPMDTRAEFIEMIGVRLQAFGLLRASGRILGLLVFDGAEMSAAKLADTLRISKASVSTGLQELLARSVVHKVSHPGDRATYYELLPSPYADLIRHAGNQSSTAAEAIIQTRDSLTKSDAARHNRMTNFARFYSEIASAFDRAGRRLHGRLRD